MTTAQLMRSSPVMGGGHGARWCDQHQRWECTGNRNRGRGPCHGSRIRGTDKCRTHAGKKTEVAIAEGQARISAWSALGTADIDYRMAVLGVLQMTWLRLAAYSELLRRQVAAEGGETVVLDESGDPLPQTSGLVGHKYAASQSMGLYATSEEVRALVSLEAAERDRTVRYAKMAHDMGIDDRLTSLAERWGDVVAGKIALMLEALDLSPQQSAKVPGLLNTYLGSIDVAALGSPAPNGDRAKRVVGSNGSGAGT